MWQKLKLGPHSGGLQSLGLIVRACYCILYASPPADRATVPKEVSYSKYHAETEGEFPLLQLELVTEFEANATTST
jgi:hypothetical protein